MAARFSQRSTLIVFFVCVFLLTSVLTALSYFHFTAYGVHELPLDLRVADYTGFNNDADAIHLGTTPPGGYLERSVTLEASQPTHFFISVQGIDFVSTSSSEIILGKNAATDVVVYATVPDDVPYGDYAGVLRVVSRRP